MILLGVILCYRKSIS